MAFLFLLMQYITEVLALNRRRTDLLMFIALCKIFRVKQDYTISVLTEAEPIRKNSLAQRNQWWHMRWTCGKRRQWMCCAQLRNVATLTESSPVVNYLTQSNTASMIANWICLLGIDLIVSASSDTSILTAQKKLTRAMETQLRKYGKGKNGNITNLGILPDKYSFGTCSAHSNSCMSRVKIW